MENKKSFLKTPLGKIIVSLAAVVVIASATVGTVFGIKNANKDLDNNGANADNTNQTPDNPDVTDPTPDNPEITDPTPDNPDVTDPTPDNPDVTDPTPDNPEITDPTPDNPEITDPETPVITEEEYKQMFLEKLPGVIEEAYNENARLPISNVEVIDYNHANTTVYFNAVRNGFKGFYTSTINNLSNSQNYEKLYENLSNYTDIEFSIEQTCIEETLADEIAAYALEQKAVKEYLQENGISNSSNFKVINASEFDVKNGYRTTSLQIKMDDKIFDVDMGARTGAQLSQREYFETLKIMNDTKLTFKGIENYQSIDSLQQNNQLETI